MPPLPSVGRALSSLASSVSGALSGRATGGTNAGADVASTKKGKSNEPPAPEVWQEPWQQKLADGFDAAGVVGALDAFDAHLATSETACTRPSTFILASEVMHHCGADAEVCADMLFNVLEAKLPEAQVCRVVAYHLLSYGRMHEAVLLLELVRETLAPAEPHSFTDLAFARFHRLRHELQAGAAGQDGAAARKIRAEMELVVSDLAHVLTCTEWAHRFAEIEWPCLVLLSWAVAWAEHRLACAAPSDDAPAEPSLWPEAQLPATTYRLGGAAGPQLDVFVWLGWDTDHTDVDLHVKEPTGEEVYYGHNRSSTTGAAVSRDFTDGYGPEVYTLPRAPRGQYAVETNYYASHQQTNATGATSAVVWSIKHMGRFDEEVISFSSVRLGKHKQRQQVLAIDI